MHAVGGMRVPPKVAQLQSLLIATLKCRNFDQSIESLGDGGIMRISGNNIDGNKQVELFSYHLEGIL